MDSSEKALTKKIHSVRFDLQEVMEKQDKIKDKIRKGEQKLEAHVEELRKEDSHGVARARESMEATRRVNEATCKDNVEREVRSAHEFEDFKVLLKMAISPTNQAGRDQPAYWIASPPSSLIEEGGGNDPRRLTEQIY